MLHYIDAIGWVTGRYSAFKKVALQQITKDHFSDTRPDLNNAWNTRVNHFSLASQMETVSYTKYNTNNNNDNNEIFFHSQQQCIVLIDYLLTAWLLIYTYIYLYEAKGEKELSVGISCDVPPLSPVSNHSQKCTFVQITIICCVSFTCIIHFNAFDQISNTTLYSVHEYKHTFLCATAYML